MMFTVFGENYYIDLDKIDKEVELKNTSGESQIHLVKYEMIKHMVETILTEDDVVDENMGMKSNEISIPFKISFNSLLMKNIINKL
jgi:hypothetical protein